MYKSVTKIPKSLNESGKMWAEKKAIPIRSTKVNVINMAYFEPEQAFSISMPQPVFEISIAYEKKQHVIG